MKLSSLFTTLALLASSALTMIGCADIEVTGSNSYEVIDKVLIEGAVRAKQYQKMIGRGLATSWFKAYPLRNYSFDWLVEIKNRGFTHVRIRVAADQYSGERLSILTDVIDQTLEAGLIPIISWVNHEAELRASEADQTNYLNWWRDLGNAMRGRSKLVAFNLFTEIGNESGLSKQNKYNIWTRKVVNILREIDPERLIILSAPSKVVNSLNDIDKEIYKNDSFMLAEWHLYASGPNKRSGNKHWAGNGSMSDKNNVRSIFNQANEFTSRTGIPTYFGAWMPMDNNTAQLNQSEVESFADFFVKIARIKEIPWTLNADVQFIDSANNRWFTYKTWGELTLDMSTILSTIMGDGDPFVSVQPQTQAQAQAQAPQAQPQTPSAPATPSNFFVVLKDNQSVKIKWTANGQNQQGFIVQRKKQRNNGEWKDPVDIASVSAQENLFIDTPGSGTYKYRVLAYNQAGMSGWTTWEKIEVP